MSHWIDGIATIASYALWYMCGRAHGRRKATNSTTPTATPAPSPVIVAEGDDQLGASLRASIKSMIRDGKIIGRGAVIKRADKVTIGGVVVLLRYELDTDQLPEAREVEARR